MDNKIASIRRAVDLLGSRSVINLINAQSIKGQMSDETIVTLNRFWDTAQDVAITCLTLAKRLGVPSVDEAYALGLFHDCGVPLMLKRFPEYMSVLEDAYAYRVLGNQYQDHEWNSISDLVLDYVGLSEYDFQNIKDNIRELGIR